MQLSIDSINVILMKKQLGEMLISVNPIFIQPS